MNEVASPELVYVVNLPQAVTAKAPMAKSVLLSPPPRYFFFLTCCARKPLQVTQRERRERIGRREDFIFLSATAEGQLEPTASRSILQRSWAA